jgi:antitoxin FitA
MGTVTVPLSDEGLRKLEKLARDAQSTPEELVRGCVEEWLMRGSLDFAAAADYVLRKNADLYRRLA